jgi:hypothetical protein
MPRAKIGAVLVGLVALLLAASWAFQLYSVPNPWAPYALAVREYLDAGLRQDSTALAKRSATTQPVSWVHDAIRRQPGTVAAWAQQLKAITGFRGGDTVTVSLTATNLAGCSPLNSVTAQLLNHSAAPRLLAISSPCMRSDLLTLRP